MSAQWYVLDYTSHENSGVFPFTAGIDVLMMVYMKHIISLCSSEFMLVYPGSVSIALTISRR